MKSLTRSFDLSFIEETEFVILLTQTAERWFKLAWFRILKIQFSIHLRVIKWFFVKLISGYLTTGVMWAHSDKAQWTKLIFSLSFQMQMNTIFSGAEFFCKRNIHNLHLSVHRISVEQPVRHSTHCMSPNKTHIFLFLWVIDWSAKKENHGSEEKYLKHCWF